MHHQISNRRRGYLTPSPSGRAVFEPARFGSYFAMALLCLLAIALVSGCASTKISDREQLVKGPLPRPNQILVYDFVATPTEVPADSALAKNVQIDAQPQTEEQIETGRKLGAEIATQLVEAIRDMGMPATHAATRALPDINDLVLRGYLVSVEEGSAAKRLIIGFGAGGSKLTVAVEGLQMTAQGLRKLGSGTVQAGGGKGPGAILGGAVLAATANPIGLIVSGGAKAYGEVSGSSTIEGRAEAVVEEIAGVLKQRFQELGWIE